MADQLKTSERRVAVVVAGAGARGGYEAGVLSVLVPRLREAGVRAPMFIGTSAGAINATIFAALSHLPPLEQARQALDVWRGISVSDVFSSPVIGSPAIALRFAGQLLRLSGVTLTSLLDTEPLRRKANAVIDWEQLRRNISDGTTTLAVVATSGADNRTAVFVDHADSGGVPPPDDDRPISYVDAEIGPEHVLASSAIPIVFPPIHIGAPAAAAGWYLDGGIRLNAPLKPALALGADAIAVVATHPVSDIVTPAPANQSPPDIDDVVVRLMDAALVDRMVEDVRTLARVNSLVESSTGDTPDGRPRIVIPYLAVCPAERGTLAQLAVRVFDGGHHNQRGINRRLRSAELRILGRALGGDGPRRGDLFSYLYFDSEFIESSIDLGRQDAEALFEGVPPDVVPWRIGPSPSPLPPMSASDPA